MPSISAAVDAIRASCFSAENTDPPRVCLVLGSGLGYLGDQMIGLGAKHVSYANIPGFPVSSVAGHAGRLIVEPNQSLLILQGRSHFYEGYSADEIVFPTRVAKELGVRSLLLTNAAGAVKEEFLPGDLMLIEDSLRFLPVAGTGAKESPYCVSARRPVFCPDALSVAKEVAQEQAQTLRSGVYAAMPGPCYETPAEVRMLRKLGADAVGMSTVLEAETAAALGLQVLGISCITNSAAGIAGPLSHSEVQETADNEKYRLGSLLLEIGKRLR